MGLCMSLKLNAVKFTTRISRVIFTSYCFYSIRQKKKNYQRTVPNLHTGEVTFHHKTEHEGPQAEQPHRSTLSLTSALDAGGWLTPPFCRFTPGKETRYPLYRRLGGPHGRSGRVRVTSDLPKFDPRTIRPVAQSVYRLSYPGPKLRKVQY
jgi:hypothetical protein